MSQPTILTAFMSGKKNKKQDNKREYHSVSIEDDNSNIKAYKTIFPYKISKKQKQKEHDATNDVIRSNIFWLSFPWVVTGAVLYFIGHLLIIHGFIVLPGEGVGSLFYAEIMLVLTGAISPFTSNCLDKYFSAWKRSRDMSSLVSKMAIDISSSVSASKYIRTAEKEKAMRLLHKCHFMLRIYMYAVKHDLRSSFDIKKLPIPAEIRTEIEDYSDRASKGAESLLTFTTQKSVVLVVQGVLTGAISEMNSNGMITDVQDGYLRTALTGILEVIGQMGYLFGVPYARQLIQLLVFVVPLYVLSTAPRFYSMYGPVMGGITYVLFVFGVVSILRASSVIQNPLERPELNTYTSNKRLSEIHDDTCRDVDVAFSQVYASHGFKINREGSLESDH